MTDRDSTTRTRARAPGEEDYPPSTAVHWRVTDPTLSGIFVDTTAMHEGRKQTNTGPAHAGSRLKLTDALGRRRPKCHPSSRTGENPPYGMIGGDRGDVGIIPSPVRASILPDYRPRLRRPRTWSGPSFMGDLMLYPSATTRNRAPRMESSSDGQLG